MDRIELSDDFGRLSPEERGKCRQQKPGVSGLGVQFIDDPHMYKEAADDWRWYWTRATRSLAINTRGKIGRKIAALGRVFRRRESLFRRISLRRKKMEDIWRTREQGTLPKPAVIRLQIPLDESEL